MFEVLSILIISSGCMYNSGTNFYLILIFWSVKLLIFSPNWKSLIPTKLLLLQSRTRSRLQPFETMQS